MRARHAGGSAGIAGLALLLLPLVAAAPSLAQAGFNGHYEGTASGLDNGYAQNNSCGLATLKLDVADGKVRGTIDAPRGTRVTGTTRFELEGTVDAGGVVSIAYKSGGAKSSGTIANSLLSAKLVGRSCTYDLALKKSG
jgi:hypothetical protein